MDYSIYQYLEKRTITIGLASFIVIVFVLPFTASVIASFGDNDNVYNFIIPLIQYKFMLIILAGVVTGIVSKQSPLINSIVVGMLGYLLWLIIISISITLSDTSYSINFIVSQSVTTISFCATGGFCVTLLRYVQTKL